MREQKNWLVGVGLVALFGCGDDGGGQADTFTTMPTTEPTSTTPDSSSEASSDEETGPCELDGNPTLSLGGGSESTPADVVDIAMVGGTAVGCGDGFVAAAGGSAVTVTGSCVGVAAVDDSTVAAATDGGEVLLLTLSGTSLTQSSTAMGTGPFHDVASDGSRVAVAAGAGGLLAFDAAGGTLTDAGALDGATDARGVAWTDNGWLVADGDAGAKLIAANGGVSASLAESTNAIDVAENAGRGLVMRGAYGVDVIDVGASLSVAETIQTEGSAVSGAIEGDIAVVATGSALMRYEIGGTPALSARIPRDTSAGLTSGWFRAVDMADGAASAGLGASIVDLAVGSSTEAGVISIQKKTTALYGDPGFAEVVLLINNVGNGPLIIAEPEVGGGPLSLSAADGGTPRQGCDGHAVFEPGENYLITLEGDISADTQIVDLTLANSDENASTFDAPIEINRPTIAVGEPAPRFTALDDQGNLLDSSVFDGQVVYLKPYAHT